MRYKLLGSSGLRVSDICLGTLNFGETKDWGVDPETAIAILERFAESGGTFIDTAPNYAKGVAEDIIGRFCAGRRDDFVIATKFTASTSRHVLAGGNNRKAMIRSVEASLRRLATDHIDLLWLHYWDGTTPLDEILRAVDDLVHAGKILYLGMSDTPAWLVSRATTIAQLRNLAPVVAVQLEYNVGARDAERDLLPMAQALDLGVLCWGPLAAGALAGGTAPRRLQAAKLSANVEKARVALNERASRIGRTPHDLALRWLMQSDRAQLIPLLGARTVEQMTALLEGVAKPIDDVLMAELDAIVPPYLGFPHDLIASAYLQRLALGEPELLERPRRSRS